MLTSERLRYIESRVRAESTVSTLELARALRVSVETVRRDFIALEGRGILTRVYGGAVTTGRRQSMEPPYMQRMSIAHEAKVAIGRLAAAQVPPTQTVFVDVGTTAQQVAAALALTFTGTVVTHSLLVATELQDATSIEVVLAPGRLRRGEWSAGGTITDKFLQGIHYDAAFISCGGLDAKAGVTDYDLDDCEVKKTVASRTERVYVVADSSKHGVVGRYEVGDWHDMGALITDTKPPPGLDSALRVAGTKLVAPSKTPKP